MAEITGARVASGIVDNDPEPAPARVIEVELARLERLLGIPSQRRRWWPLRPLGFEVVATAAGGDGAGSSARRGGLEDVAEEVARAHGYDRIPGRLPEAALPPYRPDPSEPRHRVRRILGGLGLDEVVLHALIGADDLARSGYDAADPDLIRLANPLAEQHSMLAGALPVDAGRAGGERPPASHGSVAVRGRQDVLDGRQPRPSWRRAQAAGDGRPGTPRLACSGRASRQPRPERSRMRMCDPEGPDRRPARRVGAPLPAYRPEVGEVLHPHLHPGRRPDRGCHGARLRQPGRGASAGGGGVGPAGSAGHRRDQPGALSLAPQEVVVQPVPAAQPVDRDRPCRWMRPPRWASCCAARERRAIAGRGGRSTCIAARRSARRVSYAIALRFQPGRPATRRRSSAP